MAKGKRTDSKTRAKIVVEKISNPDLSSREIRDRIGGVSHDSVCDVLKEELPQLATKSQVVAEIVNNDLSTVLNMSELAKIYSGEIVLRAKTDKKSVERNEILVANTITADSFKRHQLLTDSPTENVSHNVSITIE